MCREIKISSESGSHLTDSFYKSSVVSAGHRNLVHEKSDTLLKIGSSQLRQSLCDLTLNLPTSEGLTGVSSIYLWDVPEWSKRKSTNICHGDGE